MIVAKSNYPRKMQNGNSFFIYKRLAFKVCEIPLFVFFTMQNGSSFDCPRFYDPPPVFSPVLQFLSITFGSLILLQASSTNVYLVQIAAILFIWTWITRSDINRNESGTIHVSVYKLSIWILKLQLRIYLLHCKYIFKQHFHQKPVSFFILWRHVLFHYLFITLI